MSQPPAQPKIYHITHVDNLPSILACGGLWSDAERIRQGFPSTNVGIEEIKQRRLKELVVNCHPGTMVGEYVPFYLCPRSIMLYLLHMGNAEGLTYRGGQRPVVHLEADFHSVVGWSNRKGRRWAFSNSNAGARYTDFFADISDLDKINWKAVRATDFRDSLISQGKQAEFLVHESFPWALVEHIAVYDSAIQEQVSQLLKPPSHVPRVSVRRDWYFPTR